MPRRLSRIALALMAALLFSAPALALEPALAIEPAPAVLCHLGSEAFMVEAPEGWLNLDGSANELGLCALYAPVPGDLHSAPALIYPRMVEKGGAADPLAALLDESLENFRSRPGGENAALLPAGSATSDEGLGFQLYYIDNGPPGNDFELLALHLGNESIFLLVLSAYTPENRLRHSPDFMRSLRKVQAFEILDGGANG